MNQKKTNNRSANCYKKSMSFRCLFITCLSICLNTIAPLANATQSRKADLPAYLDYGTQLSCKFNYEQTIQLMYLACLSEIQNNIQWQELAKFNKIGSICIEKISAAPSADYLDDKTNFDYPYFYNLKKYAHDINLIHKSFGFDEQKLWLSIFENSSDSCLKKEFIKEATALTAKKMIRKHLSLPSYYTSIHKSHYPNEKNFIAHDKTVKRNSDLKTISVSDEINIGKFHYNPDIFNYLHPKEERNFLVLPLEFYNTFAISKSEGTGTTIAISNYDKSTLQNRGQIIEIETSLTNIIKNIQLKNENTLTTFSSSEDDSIFIFIEGSSAQIPHESSQLNTTKKITNFFNFSQVQREAYALKYFSEYTNASQNHSVLANYKIIRYDKKIKNYLQKFLNWSPNQFESEYQKLISLTAQNKLPNTNDMRWLLQPETFELIFALNFFKTEEFNARILFGNQTKDIFSITDFSSNSEKNYALNSIKSIAETYYILKRSTQNLNFKQTISNFLNKLIAHTIENADKGLLTEIRQELDTSSNDLQSSMQVIKRKLESTFTKQNSMSCRVAKVISHKSYRNNSFQQQGVTTLVQFPNSKTKWVTAAHVVADAEKVELKCSNSTIPLRIVYIDHLRDIAFLEQLNHQSNLKFEPIQMSLLTDLKSDLSLNFPSDSSFVSAIETYQFTEQVRFNKLNGKTIGLPHFGVKELIQIINFGIKPGMSGSPIINSKGEFVGMVTHTSLKQAESLAIPSWELLNPSDNQYQVKNSYSIVKNNIKKYLHVNFVNKNVRYHAYDLCGDKDYQSSSSWLPTNGKTDWAGGSGDKIVAGSYITSSNLNINYGRYLQTYPNCKQSGISLNGKKINALWKKENSNSKKIEKIDSAITLLQIMNTKGFDDLKVDYISGYKDISTILCGSIDKNQNKHFRFGNKSHSHSVLNHNGTDFNYIAEEFNLFEDSIDIEQSKSELVCADNSFNLIDTQTLNLRIEGDHLTGRIQVGKCFENIDTKLESYSTTYNGTNFRTNIEFNFRTDNNIKILVYDIKPHCAKNAEQMVISKNYILKNNK